MVDKIRVPLQVSVEPLLQPVHHLPDFWKALAIHHMGRILNKGGKVFLSDAIFFFSSIGLYEAFQRDAWVY